MTAEPTPEVRTASLPARAWARRSGSGVGHVLMTADTASGVWPCALTLAGALASRGVRTSLAVFSRGLVPSMRAEAWNVPGLRIFEGAFRLEWMEDPWEDVRRAGEWLLSLARVLRPDVVHLNGHVLGALGWPAPAVVVTHGSVCSRWEAVHGVAAPPGWNRYRAEVRRGLLGAARVVAPSKALLEALEHEHGPLPGARVVHHARALAPVRGLEKEPWILTAGRVSDGRATSRCWRPRGRSSPSASPTRWGTRRVSTAGRPGSSSWARSGRRRCGWRWPAPRSTRIPRCTSRSRSRRWKPRSRAARWSSPTFPRTGDLGRRGGLRAAARWRGLGLGALRAARRRPSPAPARGGGACARWQLPAGAAGRGDAPCLRGGTERRPAGRPALGRLPAVRLRAESLVERWSLPESCRRAQPGNLLRLRRVVRDRRHTVRSTGEGAGDGCGILRRACRLAVGQVANRRSPAAPAPAPPGARP